jgi:hypothetical protein
VAAQLMDEIVVLATVAVFVAIRLRAHTLGLVLGILLPIYAVGPANGTSLDLARYALGLLAISKVWDKREVGRNSTGRWFRDSIFAVAALWLCYQLIKGGPVTPPIVMMLSVAMAFPFSEWIAFRLGVLKGFALGGSLSGLFAIGQYLGVLPGADDVYGLRFSGLSSTSTLFGFELCCALAILIHGGLWSGHFGARALRVCGIGVCLGALLVSGSRGALLVVVGALLVPMWASIFRRPIALISVGALTIWAWSSGLLDSVTFNTIDRLMSGGGGGGLIAGLEETRAVRNGAAWSEIVKSPWSGVDPNLVARNDLLNPHFFPLVLGLDMGIVGIAAGCFLILVLGATWCAGTSNRDPMATLGRSLVLIGIAYSFFEPTGVFVGLERVSLMLIAVAIMQKLPVQVGAAGIRDGSRAQLMSPGARGRADRPRAALG